MYTKTKKKQIHNLVTFYNNIAILEGTMKEFRHEKHHYEDADFPFFFHVDTTPIERKHDYYHWQENVEILSCFENDCNVIINGNIHNIKKGDTLIIDPFCLHMVNKTKELGRYYCLIVGKQHIRSMGLPVDFRSGCITIRDEKINTVFKSLEKEFHDRRLCWKAVAKSHITEIVAHIFRNYIDVEKKDLTSGNNQIVTSVINYLNENLDKSFTIDELAKALGFNKYYLCHCFSASTGESIVGYLKILRCNHAKRLLISGKCTVSEAAELSGFSSFSYFSKTYKSIFGHVPSTDRSH